MVKPANARLVQKRQQINTKLQKLNELSLATSEAQDLSKQLSTLTEAVEFFQSRLPHESQIHKVLEQITLIAQKQGLKPGTISALRTKDSNGYIEQPLRMEIDGDFNAFYSFLIEIEKLPRIIRLRQLDLKKDKKNPSQIHANFVISVFFSS
ncbi:MAG: type 4a pilus biogenesis protein PilO [Anaerohalosphaeraceae bacterium]|nr:type 4a pilus biogenesis protein PilO [Anaerohalosphaeraceae bacterium]